jgi:hypothetical protein
MVQGLEPVSFPDPKPEIRILKAFRKLGSIKWKIDNERHEHQHRAPSRKSKPDTPAIRGIPSLHSRPNNRDRKTDREQKVGHDCVCVAAVVVGMLQYARCTCIAAEKIHNNHPGDRVAAKMI